MSKTNQLKMPI